MVHETAFSTPAASRKSLGATLFERNTMLKTLKRKIALVAVAGLGFGLISTVPAKAADTAVTGTVVVAPVRVTFTGTVQDTVPASPLTITAPAAWTAADLPGAAPDAKIVVTLTRAPSAGAVLTWDHAGKGRFTNQGGGGVANDFTVTLADTGEIEANGTDVPTFADTTTGYTFKADTVGTYAGTITVDGNTAADSDLLTIPFSFTTTGAVTTLKVSAASVAVPAIANQTNTYELSVLDANGNLTQPQTVDSATAAVADATNIWLAAGAATEAVNATDLADGKHTLTVRARTATPDSEVITITPAGTIGGLTAATLTASSAAEADYTGALTTVTEPVMGTVAKLVTGKTNEYQMDPSRITGAFKVSGLTVGKAYRVKVTYTDTAGGGAVYAGTLQLNARTAVAMGGGIATDTVAGIADSTSIDITWALSTATNLEAADTIIVELGAGGTPAAIAATGALVTYTTTTYVVAVTTPAVTPTAAKTGAAIAMAGTVKDLWGNAVPAATVTVTGTQTSASGAAALTKQATSDNTGAWSLTMGAAAADATSVSYVAAATKPGLTITSAAAVVVNFNTTGEATAITIADAVGDEDTATTVDKYPAVIVPYDGVASGVSTQSYDVSDAALTADFGAATMECAEVTVSTTPAAQITVTGSTGVLFYTTACAADTSHELVDGKATVEIASAGAANLWITSTKTGLNTYTVKSGSVSKTYSFWAANYQQAAATGVAARNVALTLTKASIASGELGRGTLKVTDAFGNGVKLHGAVGVTVTVAITGDALLDGPAVSKTFTTTDANGEAFFGVLAGTTAGSATITATGAGAAFGAAAGSTTTTAGVTGLTASTKTATATQTITAATAAANPAIDAVKSDVKAVSDTVATLSKAVTTIQSSVTELTTSFTAQIKSLSSAIAKISRAIAALSKKIK